MDFLDPDEWPIGAATVARICRVSVRTAQRWLSGDAEAPYTARTLVNLTQRGRIMPETWDSYFRFCSDDSLDVGHKIRLTKQMAEHHAHSLKSWNLLLTMNRDIQKRMDELERSLPRAVVIEFDNYRRRVNQMKARPFALHSGYEAPAETNVIPFR